MLFSAKPTAKISKFPELCTTNQHLNENRKSKHIQDVIGDDPLPRFCMVKMNKTCGVNFKETVNDLFDTS